MNQQTSITVERNSTRCYNGKFLSSTGNLVASPVGFSVTVSATTTIEIGFRSYFG